MKRTIFNQLIAWQQSVTRKPLILLGARQVGKTFILKHFGATAYLNSIYINFEDNPSYRRLFEASLEPEAILRALSLELNIAISPKDTLIIFDEIQECPNALNSLKYFCEQANQYHIAAAGSLLGVKLKNTKGFPVGKVDFLDLYPMSFSEFLIALDQTRLVDFLHEIQTLDPIPSNLHDKFIEYFKTYLFIGGMPEAVAQFVQTGDIQTCRKIHQDIIRAYQLDFAKHAPADIVMKINQVWDSIPSQLAKENKKFIYSVLRTGARARDFETAIQWLLEAGLIAKVYNIETPKMPLEAYKNFEIFKIYLVDVGLLGAKTLLPANVIVHGNEVFEEFKGSYVENYVATTLARLQYSLFYWTSAGTAEVDFILQNDGDIYPLEIKSGLSTKKKSLLVYADKYRPKLVVRSSPMNLKQDGAMLNIPLYLLDELPHLLARSLNKLRQ